jgi:hypothetical protein
VARSSFESTNPHATYRSRRLIAPVRLKTASLGYQMVYCRLHHANPRKCEVPESENVGPHRSSLTQSVSTRM